eukprot:SM000041S15489  [mRNA]  locus=s41:384384:386662:- [translate_table: standard]
MALAEGGRPAWQQHGPPGRQWRRGSLSAARPRWGLGLRTPWASLRIAAGLKDLLTEQKKRTADFLYRPIERSRDKLDQVLRLVGVDMAGDDALREAIDLTTAAARDCILPNAASFAGFRLRTGIEANVRLPSPKAFWHIVKLHNSKAPKITVCTFKLILKNAASLLDNADARKLDGEAALADLVRKFTALKGELLDSVSKHTGERSNLTAAVKDTVAALDNFQASIKEVLGTA